MVLHMRFLMEKSSQIYLILCLEKTMTFHNVIILIKSACNIDKNNCSYNIFLGKALYELPKK